MDFFIDEEKKAMLGGFEIPIQCMLRNLKRSGELSGIHYHDYVELLYGLDCDAEIWCNGKTYSLKSGDLVVINSKKPHTVSSLQAMSQYIVIKFMPQILYAAEQSIFEFKYIIPFITDNERYSKCFTGSLIENSEVPEIMRGIMSEWEQKTYGFEVALRIYVIKLALWLIRRWHIENDENSFGVIDETNDAIASIQKAIEYAQKNYSTATSSEAAALCNLSYSYFSRLFKRVMNKSFTEYVNYIRISEAEKLLVTGSKSVTEIALDVGFSTTSYFIERFKKQVRLTPKQFRSNYRKKP